MTIYIVIWIICFVLSFSGIFRKAKSSVGIVLILLFVFACIVAFRVDVGQDWEGYKLFYYSGYAYDKPDGKTEPIFTLVRHVCYYLGFSHAIFFLILSFFSLYALNKAAVLMNIRNHYVVFFVYLSLFFCSLQFNIFRTAIMASCVWLSFAYKSRGELMKAIIWCLIGCGFHFIAVLFLPLIFFINSNLKAKWYYGLLAVAFFLFAINLSGRILSFFPWLALIDRVESYAEFDEDKAYGLSLGMIFNLCFCLALRFLYRDRYDKETTFRILMNVLLLNNILVLSLNGLGTIVARIGQALNMTAIFLWPYVFSNIRKQTIKLGLGTLFTIYLALFYYKTWGGEGSETSKMLPYTFDISQLFDTHL